MAPPLPCSPQHPTSAPNRSKIGLRGGDQKDGPPKWSGYRARGPKARRPGPGTWVRGPGPGPRAWAPQPQPCCRFDFPLGKWRPVGSLGAPLGVPWGPLGSHGVSRAPLGSLGVPWAFFEPRPPPPPPPLVPAPGPPPHFYLPLAPLSPTPPLLPSLLRSLPSSLPAPLGGWICTACRGLYTLLGGPSATGSHAAK